MCHEISRLRFSREQAAVDSANRTVDGVFGKDKYRLNFLPWRARHDSERRIALSDMQADTIEMVLLQSGRV
jgi:hypothetical protein